MSKVNKPVAKAFNPRLDKYFCRYPWSLIDASGEAAGLPGGQMGTSELGHMTLGNGGRAPGSGHDHRRSGYGVQVRIYLPQLECPLDEGGGAIVTVSGRYYTMDRDRL